MTLFALDPWWNDFYAIGGFFVGVIGFAFTIWQLRKTMYAAAAAREAAEKTLAESKDVYERFVGAYASRMMSELQSAVIAKDWKLANIRCQDLAELLASLPASGDTVTEESTTEAVKTLRDFAQAFAEKMTTKDKASLASSALKKWKALLHTLHTRLDQLRGPFREKSYGQVRADNPTGEVQGDRSEPHRENTSTRSELGPKPNPERDT
jgi:hypothetical protein